MQCLVSSIGCRFGTLHCIFVCGENDRITDMDHTSNTLPEGISEEAKLVQVNHQGRKDAHPDSCIFQPVLNMLQKMNIFSLLKGRNKDLYTLA